MAPASTGLADSSRGAYLRAMIDLHLMTWNVRYFAHGLKGLRTTETWMRRLATALVDADHRPDLIALQEVETRSLRGGLASLPQIERFAAQLHEVLEERGVQRSYQARYFPAHRYAMPGMPAVYTTGLAFLVNEELLIEEDNTLAPEDITHVRIPAMRRWKQRRIVAHVRVRPPAGRNSLDLFNTHLSLPAFFEVGPHRIAQGMGHGSNQVEEVRKLLAAVEAHRGQGPAVIVGDFNSAPGTPAWEALRTAGYQDAFADHHDHDPAILGQWSTAAFGTTRMHIDHVFCSPGLHWEGFEEHTPDLGPYAGLSDHVPKVGTLRLVL